MEQNKEIRNKNKVIAKEPKWMIILKGLIKNKELEVVEIKSQNN